MRRKTLKREVMEAAANFHSARQRYGENNLETVRAEIRYNELKEQWKDQQDKKAAKVAESYKPYSGVTDESD